MDNTQLIEIISSKKAEYKEAERLNLITKAEKLLVEINYLEELLNYRKNSIPLAKVKQAREEMKECSYSLSCFNADVFDEDERVVDLDNVLIILDKLIAESEEK